MAKLPLPISGLSPKIVKLATLCMAELARSVTSATGGCAPPGTGLIQSELVVVVKLY
jgi:hypothetical protein